MRPRNTLLLLLVLAALGAYVYWVELPHEKREAEQKQLLTFEKDKVASITLEYPDHQIALARDADKHWRLVKPIEAPADDTAANFHAATSGTPTNGTARSPHTAEPATMVAVSSIASPPGADLRSAFHPAWSNPAPSTASVTPSESSVTRSAACVLASSPCRARRP